MAKLLRKVAEAAVDVAAVEAMPPVAAEAGLNTFVWNYRLPNATPIEPLILWAGSTAGPRVPPGSYSVRLTVDGKPVSTEAFAIKEDPRVP